MRTIMRIVMVCLPMVCLLVPAGTTLAQEKPAAPAPENPLSTWNKKAYGHVRTSWCVRRKNARGELQLQAHGHSPQLRPDHWTRGGRPVPVLLGRARGEESRAGHRAHQTSKADLIAALNAGFAYCDKAYDGMTDASAVETIKLFGNDAPRLSALTVNNMHNLEHYGNLVTYMRLKNIVPPSSEAPPQAQPQPKK